MIDVEGFLAALEVISREYGIKITETDRGIGLYELEDVAPDFGYTVDAHAPTDSAIFGLRWANLNRI